MLILTILGAKRAGNVKSFTKKKMMQGKMKSVRTKGERKKGMFIPLQRSGDFREKL